ncbi:ergothioneine biosynthesis protein EgtB [Notoacmeibacter marinus]|uniref:ergothioneine biosynthesis protein EgtB n=1 Tax=Notoacmeibacter marinus TaxID=1876515 RepID=UPI000DF465D5|nr:ergothioneine biosynthesis protein EgtB [Notoacmeibacter marinus]
MTALFAKVLDDAPLLDLFRQTRQRSLSMIEGLEPEDMAVQSMEDASPTKWHLAHTSWFFEEFVLRPCDPAYSCPDERFAFLFNSYYVQAGPRYTRAQRGLVTRPTICDVLAYRAQVDEAVERLVERGAAPADIVELGCHHEMQHQELMLTDLLHVLSHNPLRPAYRKPEPLEVRDTGDLSWLVFEGGILPVGHGEETFAYDCETPRHDQLIRPFEIANRCVTNREWIAFIEDGGYAHAPLWLMDGFATVQREDWRAPAYWWQEDGQWMQFSLRGAQPVDPDAPVSHVSYYEADAYARWAGARLPSEFEWEVASGPVAEGNFHETGRLRPSAVQPGDTMLQMWGDVWEWTASAFLPYPGFQTAEGAVGEYNGKFMVNQFVLRGGSCFTPAAQMRRTYRNFFYPHHRWQMTGLRLARDA